AARAQPVEAQLLGQQVALGNGQLLLARVPRDLDQLHAVQQRLGDGVHAVGGRDEEDRAQVEGQVDVVVRELVVLLRVQHLEQGRGRVPPTGVPAQLVHLVQQQHGVPGARLLQRGQDAARQRPDVRAPVAADLGLVGD
ncbi:unnamed protein product, partial [Heterosigma akashiwo]